MRFGGVERDHDICPSIRASSLHRTKFMVVAEIGTAGSHGLVLTTNAAVTISGSPLDPLAIGDRETDRAPAYMAWGACHDRRIHVGAERHVIDITQGPAVEVI